MPEKPAKPDQPTPKDEGRVVIPLDPEDALRALLKVDPESEPADAGASTAKKPDPAS